MGVVVVAVLGHWIVGGAGSFVEANYVFPFDLYFIFISTNQ